MYKIIVNRLETQVYNQQHTKSILAKERTVLTQKLNVVKNENQQMAREIQRNKMFNKKDQDRKAKKEQADKLAAIIKDLNKDIEEHDVKLDMEKRRLDDRSLLKKQMEVTMQLKQDFNKVNIDISIAESRIKDLEVLRELLLLFNLLIEHVLGFGLFFLKPLHEVAGYLPLELERVGDLLQLLALGVELLGLLLLLGDALTCNLYLDLLIVLLNCSLFGDDVLQL